MKLKEIKIRKEYAESKLIAEALKKLQSLKNALEKRHLPEKIATEVNNQIESLNSFEGPEKKLLIHIKTAEDYILTLVRKEMNLTPEKYYTFLWMPLGMATFGLPLGTLIFAITDNAAFIGTGLPLGIGLGTFIGMSLDQQAKKAKRVLAIE